MAALSHINPTSEVTGQRQKKRTVYGCDDGVLHFLSFSVSGRGRDSVVGMASSLWAACSGHRIPVVTRFFAPIQTGPGAHPASYTMRTGSFPGVNRPRRGVDHPPHLVQRLKKDYGYISPPLWAFVMCSTLNFIFYFTFTFTKFLGFDRYRLF